MPKKEINKKIEIYICACIIINQISTLAKKSFKINYMCIFFGFFIINQVKR